MALGLWTACIDPENTECLPAQRAVVLLPNGRPRSSSNAQRLVVRMPPESSRVLSCYTVRPSEAKTLTAPAIHALTGPYRPLCIDTSEFKALGGVTTNLTQKPSGGAALASGTPARGHQVNPSWVKALETWRGQCH